MAKKRKSRKPLEATPTVTPQRPSINCYEGDRLDELLAKLRRSIEDEKLSKGEQLPDKLWTKQQFAIGVNEVTRMLLRMPEYKTRDSSAQLHIDGSPKRAPLVSLQAILLASDCNPRLITKHVQNLASSRHIPLIYVKDKRGGSLKLGELVKLKTAVAIGVKARGSCVNATVDGELL